MTADEFRRQLHEVSFTAGMNCRYNGTLAWWWEHVDLWCRIAVVIFALSDLVTGASGHSTLALSFLSFLSALVLILLSLDGRARKYSDLYRRWSLLETKANSLNKKTVELKGDIPPTHVGTLYDLQDEAGHINADESAPWRKLLDRCYEAQMKAEYGDAIITFEEADAQNEARLAKHKEICEQETKQSTASDQPKTPEGTEKPRLK